MKIYFTFLLFLICTTIYSQTTKEKNTIINQYDINKLNDLKLNLTIANKANNEAIDEYIKKNWLKKRQKKQNGGVMEIRYIINDKPVYVTTDNIDAAQSTKTDHLHNGGSLGLNLEGQNMNIGIWDGGAVLITHDEFLNSDASASRVSKGETLITVNSDHATHVAGTMIAKGTNANSKGMAPQANLISYDWTNDSVEVVNEIATDALLLSNHSYGIPVLNGAGALNVPTWMMGCYNSVAVSWDQIAYDAPYYLMVVSAGNSGEAAYTGGLLDGYDKLTGEKNSKNNLVIASSEPFVFPGGNIILNPDSFSSQGPSDDGRVKPDLTGDGSDLFSSISTTNNSYGILSGTSMSTPNTSGSLLLLQQYYNELHSKFMKASTLKGLVCHTAYDDVANIGPDPNFGWGLLNAKNAVETILDDYIGSALILETNLANNSSYTKTFTATGTIPLSATICWTDPAGADQSGNLNSPTPALVNDLDLRLTAPDGTTTFFPWKLQLSDVSAAAITGDNIVDNIENIDIETPVAGTYTLKVTHKGTLVNSSQDFSIIITGSDLTLSTNKNTLTDFVIWPNPAVNILHYKLNSTNNNDTLISLVDLQGRTVYNDSFSSNNKLISGTINTESLSQGVYFLRIKQGNTTITKKVIIE
jgi:hypothetical protein